VQAKLTYLNEQTLVELQKECARRRLPSTRRLSKMELVAQLFVLECT
jgi:hypothetical protein